MDKVIKIILSILGALLIFLAGWFLHALKNRDKVAKEVKEAIKELNEQHKTALKALRDDYDDKIKKKDEIISKLKIIIERLLNRFESVEGEPGVEKVINNLKANQAKLYRL